jgi:hypothetical protein
MSKTRKKFLFRGALVVGLSALLAGAMLTPSLGGSFLTKKKANKSFIKKTTANSTFVAKTNVMAATVPFPCTSVTKSTGGITAAATGTQCKVTFPKDITKCTVLVSPFLATGVTGGEAVYSETVQGTNTIQVGRFDSAGGTSTAGLFSILVVCP